MSRPAFYQLDQFDFWGVDSLLFINDNADDNADGAGRSNGLDRATVSAAANTAFGLEVAVKAPDDTPVEPEMPNLPDTGPFLSFEISGVVVMEPQFFNAKGGTPGPPGGGGGGGSDPGVLNSYTSIGASGNTSIDYNVEIIFKGGGWTTLLQDAFTSAADYLSTIITADIANVFFRGKIIDDIRIDAKLSDIDGEGGILGQAGPTAYRTASFLPATAIMEFDIADAEYYDGLNLFDDIVMHEMMHSIGFGTMWELMGLTSGSIENEDLLFIGANAMAAYAGGVVGVGGVPIEDNTGLAGTDGGHWDEETFGNELMTGFINLSGNYLSTMTVAALEDMGYDTLIDDPSDPNDSYGKMPADPIYDLLIA